MPSLAEVYAYETSIDNNSVEWQRLMATLENRQDAEWETLKDYRATKKRVSKSARIAISKIVAREH